MNFTGFTIMTPSLHPDLNILYRNLTLLNSLEICEIKNRSHFSLSATVLEVNFYEFYDFHI